MTIFGIVTIFYSRN